MKMISMIQYLALTVIFISGTSVCLSSSDKIFERIRIKDNKTIYYIDIPVSSNFSIALKGYHGGITYDIYYKDSSEIYYNSDRWAVTSNFQNIQIREDLLPNWWRRNDTIVFGKQANGKYWKEINKGGILVGYLNVSSEEKVLYDSSLNTFRKNKQLLLK